MSVRNSGWEKTIPIIPATKSNLSVSGNECIEKLLKDFNFSTVLDLGCGSGAHTEIFQQHNKIVTSLDAGHYYDFKPDIVGQFEQISFDNSFDAIWCSHVLEHVFDVHSFLVKIYDNLNDNGILAITVPPLKHDLVSGHCNLFNTGLLIYRLVLAGFDCSNACAKVYGYNLSVIVQKGEKIKLGEWSFPKIQQYFPFELKQNVDGRILNVNWD
jgi:SAM-dependent methyltransferase